MITGNRNDTSVLFFFGFFFYCFSWILASKREIISIVPLTVGIIGMLSFPIVENYHKLMIRYSDITTKISVIMLVLYLFNINNKKIQRIQRNLFLPSFVLNIVSIILLIIL